MAATPRIGRVTPRAISHTSSRPTMAAARPRLSSSKVPLVLSASSSCFRVSAGPVRAFSGTSSNTPQGWASGIGRNAASTFKRCRSWRMVSLPSASLRTNSAPLTGSTWSKRWASLLASAL
ncbi:hypothetical protein D9M73_181140 [compost metagenome]